MSSKIINVIFSEDCHDCELCGADWANSTLIEYEKWSYGGYAEAYCFGTENFYADDCFHALFKHLGVSFDGSDNSGEEDFIKFLEGLGYTVEVERQEVDDDYYNDTFYPDDDWDD